MEGKVGGRGRGDVTFSQKQNHIQDIAQPNRVTVTSLSRGENSTHYM